MVVEKKNFFAFGWFHFLFSPFSVTGNDKSKYQSTYNGSTEQQKSKSSVHFSSIQYARRWNEFNATVYSKQWYSTIEYDAR